MQPLLPASTPSSALSPSAAAAFRSLRAIAEPAQQLLSPTVVSSQLSSPRLRLSRQWLLSAAASSSASSPSPSPLLSSAPDAELAALPGEDWQPHSLDWGRLVAQLLQLGQAEAAAGEDEKALAAMQTQHSAFLEAVVMDMQKVRSFVGRRLTEAGQSLLALHRHSLWPQQPQQRPSGCSSASSSSPPPLLNFSAGMTDAFALLVCQLYPQTAHQLLPRPLYARTVADEMSGPPATASSAAFAVCYSLWRLGRGMDQLRIFMLSNSLRQQRLLCAYHRLTGRKGRQHQQLLSRLQRERLGDHGCLQDVTGRVAESVEQLLQSAIRSCPSSSSPPLLRPVLHCSGCEEALEASPAVLSCGHLCCYGCVLRLVDDSGSGGVCFVCSSEVVRNELRLDTLYSQLAIHCQPPSRRRSPGLQLSCVSASAFASTPSSSPVTASPLSSSEQHTPVSASPSPSLPLTAAGVTPPAVLLPGALAAAAAVAIAPVAPLALAAPFARAAAAAAVMPLKRKSRFSSSASLMSASQAGNVAAVSSSAAHPRSRSSGSLSSLVPHSSVIFLGEPEVEPVKATTVMRGLYLSYRRSARRRRHRASPTDQRLEPQLSAVISSNGSSCHQCKNRKASERLRSCSSSSDVAGQRGPCRKKFCVDCLERTYGQEAAQQADRQLLTWTCPACRLLCPCGRCKSKAESRKQKEAQRQLDASQQQEQQLQQRQQQQGRTGAEERSQCQAQALPQPQLRTELVALSDSSSGAEDEEEETSDDAEAQELPATPMTRQQLVQADRLLGLASTSTHRLPLFTHEPHPAMSSAQLSSSHSTVAAAASSLLLHSSPAPLRVQSRRLLAFPPPTLSAEEAEQLQQEQRLTTAASQPLDELRVLTLQSALSSARTSPQLGAHVEEATVSASSLQQPSPPFAFPSPAPPAQLPPHPDWDALARCLHKAAQAAAAVAASCPPPSPGQAALSLHLSLQTQQEEQRRAANWQAVCDHLMHRELLMQMQRQKDMLDSARRTLEAADDGGHHTDSPLQPQQQQQRPTAPPLPCAHPLPLSLTISHQTAFTHVDAAAFAAMHECSHSNSAMHDSR